MTKFIGMPGLVKTEQPMYLASTVLNGLYFWTGCLEQRMNLRGTQSTCVVESLLLFHLKSNSIKAVLNTRFFY